MNRPVKKWKAGAVSVGVFENNGKARNGETVTFYSVQLQRSFKDAKGEWQNTSNLSDRDIPKAIMLLQKVYEYIHLQATGSDEQARFDVVN